MTLFGMKKCHLYKILNGVVVRYYGNWKWCCFYIVCHKPIKFGHLVGNKLCFTIIMTFIPIEGKSNSYKHSLIIYWTALVCLSFYQLYKSRTNWITHNHVRRLCHSCWSRGYYARNVGNTHPHKLIWHINEHLPSPELADSTATCARQLSVKRRLHLLLLLLLAFITYKTDLNMDSCLHYLQDRSQHGFLPSLPTRQISTWILAFVTYKTYFNLDFI